MSFKPRERSGLGLQKGTLLKIESGKPIQGVVMGDPITFKTHWDMAKCLTVRCQGANCEACRLGDRSKFRFRVNFITKENGNYIAKVLEGGGPLYDRIEELASAGHELSSHIVQISKSGEGKDTRYSIIPVAKGELTLDQRTKLSMVKLHDLGR